MVVNVGIIGFGFMGKTHYRAYQNDPRARLAGLMSINPASFTDATAGNIPGTGELDDYSHSTIYKEAQDLFDNDEIQALSICTPTQTHAALAVEALRCGKHVLLEKPLCRSSDEAESILQAAQEHNQLICLPAMCMRFWPAWSWLRTQIIEGTYGATLSASFTRLGSAPQWGDGFYQDAGRCGGGILDLHIHDVDFIRYCFGEPLAVKARGRVGVSGGIDHVIANFVYDSDVMVHAEGGWLTSPNFPFRMSYTVTFEEGVAEYRMGREHDLMFYDRAGEAHVIEHPDGSGYDHEISHFLDCVESGRQSDVVTVVDGAASLRLVEAEIESIEASELITL